MQLQILRIPRRLKIIYQYDCDFHLHCRLRRCIRRRRMFFVSVEISVVSDNVELRVYSIQSWVCGSEFGVNVVPGKLNRG